MKAIISDIHSNLEALQAVLADIKSQNITEIYCLGDVVGYGPNPRECVDLVKSCKLVIMGNHDQGAMFDPDGFNGHGREGDFLDPRPTRSDEPRAAATFARSPVGVPGRAAAEPPRERAALYVHGSARNPLNEYVFPEDVYNQRKMERIYSRSSSMYCFQGHTHVPGVFTENMQFVSPEETKGTSPTNSTARKTLCNVGSVGQPRDGNWRACYVVLDNETITFRRVEYDVDTTVRKIYDVPDLDNFLGDRLRDGR